MSRSLWADAYVVGGEVTTLVGLALKAAWAAWRAVAADRPPGRPPSQAVPARHPRRHGADADRVPAARQPVHAEYAEAVRWLCWLGFALAPPGRGARGRAVPAVLDRDLRILPAASPTSRRHPISRRWRTNTPRKPFDGMPPPDASWPQYRELEGAGLLHAFAAKRATRCWASSPCSPRCCRTTVCRSRCARVSSSPGPTVAPVRAFGCCARPNTRRGSWARPG